MSVMMSRILRVAMDFWNHRQPREQGFLIVLGGVLVGVVLLQGGQALMQGNVRLENQLSMARTDVEYLEARSGEARRRRQGMEAGVHQLTLMFPGMESHPVKGGVELHWRGRVLVSWLQALDRVSDQTEWVVRKMDIERHAEGVEVWLVVTR